MAATTAPAPAPKRLAPERPAPHRPGRFARLLAAGLVDSFGMTLGWTVFSLLVLDTEGLAGLGVCNAAMLVGVALSAPATAWLAPRMEVAWLLRSMAATEAVLRVASFALLLAGTPLPLLAVVVAVMYAAGLAAYAGMRAEARAASRPGRAAATMTLFVVAVMGVEAAGVATAALLPGDPPGSADGLLAGVVAVYGCSQLPTLLVARGARVGRAPRRAAGRGRPQASPSLLAGALIMLLGSGPALLAVGLAAELHGPRWVAASALAFTAGTLLAPWAVALADRRGLPAVVTWPAWGAGMLAGWVLAPADVAWLLAAQVLAGLCIAAFEGGMDAHVAARQAQGQLMGSLAASEAVRALGAAAAVAALPVVAGTRSIAAFSAAGGIVFLAAILVGLLAHAGVRLARLPGPAPALAASGAGAAAGLAPPLRPSAGLVFDWRRVRMEPYGPQLPEAPDEWARMLKDARSRRRRPAGQLALVVLLVLAFGALMFQVGQAVAPTRPAAARPAPGQPAGQPVSGYGLEDDDRGAGSGQGAGYGAAPTTAPAPPTTAAPARAKAPPAPAAKPRPRLLRLVTENVQTEANPNRVYLAPGQVDAAQARRGRRPRFTVRPGQLLRVQVDNRDLYIHSFTFARSRVNLDVWEGTRAAATFKAPGTRGTYQFYCRYRKIGMSGTFVVRGPRAGG
jgi:plastocyanin